MVDPCGLTGPFKEKISGLADVVVSYDDYPGSQTEIVNRIGDADGVLVSWNTRINGDVLNSCPSVKYIGMCCSLYDEKSANVDIATAKKLGIKVAGVRDYGDEGTVEFIFAQIISLLKGLGPDQWHREPTELTGKSLGIIGMGTLGKMVSDTALHFGMKVFYHSRTRKEDVEKNGITYLPLNELVQQCDIITTHLPRNTVVLKEEEFKTMKKDAILINTSLGQPFDMPSFLHWIDLKQGNYAIFDAAGYGEFRNEFEKHPNIILTHKSSGFTIEAKYRLTRKVYENIIHYLNS